MSGRKPLVLVVEDDPHGMVFLESSLALSGYEVLAAKSVPQAMRKVEKQGIASIDAVITDYRLPGPNGLDLLEWLKGMDENLAVVIITGQGEKSIVKSALAMGAFDYLDKPFTYHTIINVLLKAIQSTNRHRQFAEDRRGLEDLERLDHMFNEQIPEKLTDRVRLIYRPLHEVGGDFFITHCSGDDRCVVLVGDISGHDIRSGYVSTYFQGLFRGYMESGGAVEGALMLLNRALRQSELNSSNAPAPISLAAALIELDLPNQRVRHWNYGLTPCQVIDSHGFAAESTFGNFPLGWMDQIDTTPTCIPLESSPFLYLFTDGLLEYAGNLNISPLSLFYRLMAGGNHFADLPLEPSDDILALKFKLNSNLTLNTSFEPFLSEHYAGTEIEHIDHLQSVWRRSINFALGDALGDRLYDLLICIREGMINAFTHGCDRAQDKFAHLQISVNPDQTCLRVRIDDPGKGHSFDLAKRLEELRAQTGEHLGLGIIHHLSDDFQVDNNGTTLVFDFKISPEAE